MRNEVAALASREVVLERMIRDELMEAEALRRGYDKLPEIDDLAKRIAQAQKGMFDDEEDVGDAAKVG